MGDVQERKEAGRGGAHAEGVQVWVGRCVQIHAGKGPGEGEAGAHLQGQDTCRREEGWALCQRLQMNMYVYLLQPVGKTT